MLGSPWGFNVFDVMVVVGMFVTIMTFLAYIIPRRLRRNAWGREYGMHRSGKTWRGRSGGIRIELYLEEEDRAETDPSYEVHGRDLHTVSVSAKAELASVLPRGLTLENADVAGGTAGERVITGDDDFDRRFRINADDPSAAAGLFANESLRNVLLNIGATSRDLRVHKNAVHLRADMVQRTIDDPGEILTRAYRAVLRTAQALSNAVEGNQLKGVETIRRSSPNRKSD